MKTISNLEVQENVDAVLDCAQSERVVVTRNGKPSAVIVGLESYDDEDLQLASSPEFWRMIQERRGSGSSIPLSELRTRLNLNE
jgi:prevent-host-death family protein